MLTEILGMNQSEKEYIENEKVHITKISAENQSTVIELLEPSDKSSTVQKFLDKKGSGIHHIALTVDSIMNIILHLRSNNIDLVYDVPQKGSDNKLITFIHPKSTPGLLIELCQRT